MKKEAIGHNIFDDLNARNDNWDKLDGVPERVDVLETNTQETKVKISSVEKELNDYKSTMANVNVNQEAKQKISGYGVVSLPKNTANGQVSVSVKGETRRNIATVIAKTAINSTANCEEVKLEVGKTYTLSIYIDNSLATAPARVRVNDITPTYFVGNSILAGTKGYSTTTFTVLVTGKHIISLQQLAIDGGTTVGTEILLEETTERKSFINNSKSTVSASRLKSVGKNLFDYNSATIYKDEKIPEINVGKFAFYKTHSYATSNFSHEEGVYEYIANDAGRFGYSLVFRGSPNTIYNLYYYGNDVSGGVVNIRPGWNTKTIETDTEGVGTARVFEARYNTSKVVFSNVMVTKTLIQNLDNSYEPYKESTQYLPNVGELRSLPNGVKDEVRVSGGKAEHIQRTKKYVLQASDISTIDTTLVNSDFVYITKPADFVYKGTTDTKGNSAFMLEGYQNYVGGSYDSATNHFRIASSAGNNSFILIVPKGTYATLATAKTTLAGKELNYQLANEIVTPIQVSGNLISYPSGTVYIEHGTYAVGLYGENGITVTETELPIKEINKITKIDYETGLEYELDTSKVVVSEDGLLFTHEDLEGGDIVFFDYDYSIESTQSETTIEYYDSRYVIEDTENGNFYQWKISSTNGTPNIELVEV